jgi:hypothetical protein
MIYLALALVGVLGSVGSLATDPGPAACSNITSQLDSKLALLVTTLEDPSCDVILEQAAGPGSVANEPTDAYKPSCVVYPSSSEDVSVALQAIQASGSRFAVRGDIPPGPYVASVVSGSYDFAERLLKLMSTPLSVDELSFILRGCLCGSSGHPSIRQPVCSQRRRPQP